MQSKNPFFLCKSAEYEEKSRELWSNHYNGKCIFITQRFFHDKSSSTFHFETTRIIPCVPSTSTTVPSFHSDVAFSTPVIHGNPYSLATNAPCCKTPPISKITADALTNNGVHPGSVALATRMSPLRRGFSDGVWSTFI